MQFKLRNIFYSSIIVAFFVYLTFFIYVEFFPLNYNNINNTRWWLVKNTLNQKYNIKDSTITILFVGDSRLNAALDYTKIKNSWSFGLGGATPIEIYYVIKKYINVYSKPDTILVSISPRFMTELYAFWDLAVKNDFFTKKEFIEIAENTKLLNDKSLNKFPKLRYLLNKLNFPTYFQEDLRNNLVIFGKNKNMQIISYVMSNRGKRPHPNLKESCSDLNYETGMCKFEPSPLFDFYFDKILQLCKDEQIMLIFVAMPMNESSFKCLNSAFVQQYSDYMDKKQKNYPAFNISNKLYSLPDSLFGDNSHLNAKGTEFFTNDFLKGQLFFRVL